MNGNELSSLSGASMSKLQNDLLNEQQQKMGVSGGSGVGGFDTSAASDLDMPGSPIPPQRLFNNSNSNKKSSKHNHHHHHHSGAGGDPSSPQHSSGSNRSSPSSSASISPVPPTTTSAAAAAAAATVAAIGNIIGASNPMAGLNPSHISSLVQQHHQKLLKSGGGGGSHQETADALLLSAAYQKALQQSQVDQGVLGASSSANPSSTGIVEDFCELCNKQFCNKYYLKKHKLDVHGIVVDNNIKAYKKSDDSPSGFISAGGSSVNTSMSGRAHTVGGLIASSSNPSSSASSSSSSSSSASSTSSTSSNSSSSPHNIGYVFFFNKIISI